MEEGAPAKRPWKHILALGLWLTLALPIGLWKLWHDPVLSTADKWRVLVYLCVVPLLAYITASIWMTSASLQRLMP